MCLLVHVYGHVHGHIVHISFCTNLLYDSERASRCAQCVLPLTSTPVFFPRSPLPALLLRTRLAAYLARPAVAAQLSPGRCGPHAVLPRAAQQPLPAAPSICHFHVFRERRRSTWVFITVIP